MKGLIELELRDPKKGKVLRHIKDHNLVTNFFQEYYREVGPSKGLPVDYRIENMVGGVLLFKDQITAEASNVFIPPGNRMIGNACTGIVNGQGTMVTELGSYVDAECKWTEEGNYQQKWIWGSGQAVGSVGCVALTSKVMGFSGNGNETSDGYIQNGDYDLRGMNLGTEFARYTTDQNSTNYNYRSVLQKHGNFIDWIENRSILNNDTYSASVTGKFIVHRTIFPVDTIDFRHGQNINCFTTETFNIDVPDNVRADFMSKRRYAAGNSDSYRGGCSNTITRNASGAHWTMAYTSYIDMDERDIFCFHYNNEAITAQKITLPETVMEGLLNGASRIYFSDIIAVCDESKLVVFRYYSNQSNIYVIDLSNYTVTTITQKVPTGTHGATYPRYNISQILAYHAGVWYFRAYTEQSGGNRYLPFKIDTVSNRAAVMNGYAYYENSGNYGQQIFPDAEYPLVNLIGQGYAFRRNAMYLATIYNLQSPIAKTADLELALTYTLTF